MSSGFDGKKVIVIGGSAGRGRQAAIDVVSAGGSAVIVGRDSDRVADTVSTLSATGKAWGVTAELTDRATVAVLQQQLADEHADATLLVNAAGFFVPRPFLDYDEAFYDSYLSLNYALFFLTQTVANGMIAQGGGSIVFVGSMWAHQAIGLPPSSGYSSPKKILTPPWRRSPRCIRWGGSAPQPTLPTRSPSCWVRSRTGSPAPSSTWTAESWLDATRLDQ